MATWERFYLKVGEAATTASMEKTLVALLSLHLCGQRDRAAVRAWCQQQIDRDPGAFEGGASSRLHRLAVLEIAPRALQDAFWHTELEKEARRVPSARAKARAKKKTR
jgi:hypothetical protein